jgi:hypothetical protein
MKSIYNNAHNLQAMSAYDFNQDEAFNAVMDEYDLMESHVIYFSAGDSRIKEILLKKEPTYSV